jgi:hypothetical protein
VTIRFTDRKWRVVAVPPTFKIRGMTEDDLEGVTDLDIAIQANALIPDVRKERLLEEIAGWPTPRGSGVRTFVTE